MLVLVPMHATREDVLQPLPSYLLTVRKLTPDSPIVFSVPCSPLGQADVLCQHDQGGADHARMDGSAAHVTKSHIYVQRTCCMTHVRLLSLIAMISFTHHNTPRQSSDGAGFTVAEGIYKKLHARMQCTDS
jgi:hypothetical protein